MIPVSLACAVLLLGAVATEGSSLKWDKVNQGENRLFKQDRFADCQERWDAGEIVPGVYTIYPNDTYPVEVYCNHSVEATSTVMQRRYYGNEIFNRNWQNYKVGFGSPLADYWIGLDTINLITSPGNVHLRIDMTDWSGVTYTVTLYNFVVQPESAYYRMTYKSFNAPIDNDFHYNNGMYFYSPDRPDQGNCAVHQKCGWWFNYQYQCAYALPNGVYYPGGHYPPGQYYDGIYYKDWHGFDYSLRYVTMSLYR